MAINPTSNNKGPSTLPLGGNGKNVDSSSEASTAVAENLANSKSFNQTNSERRSVKIKRAINNAMLHFRTLDGITAILFGGQLNEERGNDITPIEDKLSQVKKRLPFIKENMNKSIRHEKQYLKALYEGWKSDCPDLKNIFPKKEKIDLNEISLDELRATKEDAERRLKGEIKVSLQKWLRQEINEKVADCKSKVSEADIEELKQEIRMDLADYESEVLGAEFEKLKALKNVCLTKEPEIDKWLENVPLECLGRFANIVKRELPEEKIALFRKDSCKNNVLRALLREGLFEKVEAGCMNSEELNEVLKIVESINQEFEVQGLSEPYSEFLKEKLTSISGKTLEKILDDFYEEGKKEINSFVNGLKEDEKDPRIEKIREYCFLANVSGVMLDLGNFDKILKTIEAIKKEKTREEREEREEIISKLQETISAMDEAEREEFDMYLEQRVLPTYGSYDWNFCNTSISFLLRKKGGSKILGIIKEIIDEMAQEKEALRKEIAEEVSGMFPVYSVLRYYNTRKIKKLGYKELKEFREKIKQRKEPLRKSLINLLNINENSLKLESKLKETGNLVLLTKLLGSLETATYQELKEIERMIGPMSQEPVYAGKSVEKNKPVKLSSMGKAVEDSSKPLGIQADPKVLAFLKNSQAENFGKAKELADAMKLGWRFTPNLYKGLIEEFNDTRDEITRRVYETRIRQINTIIETVQKEPNLFNNREAQISLFMNLFGMNNKDKEAIEKCLNIFGNQGNSVNQITNALEIIVNLL
ncbi:MAG: hypothetical protein ACSW8C_02045, partial [bacterium]